MRGLFIPAALLSLLSCTAPPPPGEPFGPVVSTLNSVFLWLPPGPGRMTLSNFELPLNATRIIDTPPGADVCWRRLEPPLEQAVSPGVPRFVPWNRAYTSSGRIVDSRL